MKTIFADFNALTESESVRLTTRGSEADVQRYGVQSGDWVWLSDGELQVGARVAEDDRSRLVAIPAWDTMVHLSDEPPMTLPAIETELKSLFNSDDDSPSVEHRVLQLLSWWETRAPNAQQGACYIATRRAVALRALGHGSLALETAEDAMAIDPNDPSLVFVRMRLLTEIDPARALREAEIAMEATDPAAIVVAASVNVLSGHADQLSGEEFCTACRRVLDWSMRFENAPGRQDISGAILALVRFNQGMAHLGLGAAQDARRRFREAQFAYPNEWVIGALQLDSYGQQAKDLAARLRSRLVAA